MQMNLLEDWLKTGWARDSQTRTRLFDSLFCITRSLESNVFSVLHDVIKVTLHYYIMLHRFEFFSALELSRTALLGCHLDRSLASSRGRTLAIRIRALVNKSTFERGAYCRWVESLRYLLLNILTLRLLLFVMRFIKSILGYWVVCGTVHFCCYYFFDEINGIIYNPMDLVNSKSDN